MLRAAAFARARLPCRGARAAVEGRLVEELAPRKKLVLGHAAAIVAEEHGADETDRRDRHRTVDSGGDPEPERADERAALLRGVVPGIDPPLLEHPPQRDGIVESDGDPAEPAAQHLGGGEERPRVLLLLLAA